MNRNLKIIIGIAAVIILVLVLVNIFKDNSSIEETYEEENAISDIKYDDKTGEYYIENEETGEILYSASSEEDLYIYTIDPNYNPKLPAEDTILIENEIEE